MATKNSGQNDNKGADQRATAPGTVNISLEIAGREELPTVRFLQTEENPGDLTVVLQNGSTVVAPNYLVLAQAGLPPTITLTDGTVIPGQEILTLIPDLNLDEITPAAGNASNISPGSGAAFTPYVPQSLGDGLDHGSYEGSISLQNQASESIIANASTPPILQKTSVEPTSDLDTSAPTLNDQIFSYEENQAENAVVATVAATDSSGITSFSFAATGTQLSADGYFTINSAGEISITAAGVAASVNDFETAPTSGSYNVIAANSTGNQTTATITLNQTNVNEAPIATDDTYATDLKGIAVNTVKTDGALTFDSTGANPELLGGATSVDISVSISTTSSNSNSILSYAVASQNNEFLIYSNDAGTRIGIYIDGSVKNFSLGSSIYDGAEHTVAVSWDSATGTTTLSVDGVNKGSYTLAQGHTLGTDGILMLGQEQDSVGGGLDSNQIFSGNYHDLQISTNGTAVAHWQMDSIVNGTTEDSVGSFDLTLSGDTNGIITLPNPLVVAEDTPLTIDTSTLLDNDSDIDGDALTITSVSNPQNGTVSLNTVTQQITFTPNENFNGEATFDYEISDGNGGTDTAQVTVNVTPVNDAPVAVDDSYTENFDTIGVNTAATNGALVFDSTGANPELLGGATSVDISVSISTTSSNSNSILSYAVASQNNEFLIYSNDAGTRIGIYIDGSVKNFSLGSSIYDGAEHTIAVSWDSATGTTTLSVDGVNKGSYTLAQGHTLGTDGILMLGQEQDSVGGGLDSNQIFSGNYHDLQISTNGTAVAHWEMDAINAGKVSDSVGGFDLSATGDVVVVAQPNPLETNEDTTLVIDAITLLGDDSDIDGDTLEISGVTATADTHGSVTLNGNGTISYTPDANYNGEATFDYTISDGNGGNDTATVTINVKEVNDPPVIEDVTLLQPPNHDMVFWYDMDTDPTADKSSNGHDASKVGTTDIYTTKDHTDINIGTYTEKSIAVSFTTADVNASDPFQVIYEQGGGVNGYSISIKGDHLYATVWGESYSTISPDHAVIDLGVITPNTDYNVVMVHDANASGGGTLTAFLNGAQNPDIKSGVGQMGGHSGDVGIGGYDNDTIDPTNPTADVRGNGGAFQGEIHEVMSWNTAETTSIDEINNYLNQGNATTISISAEDRGIVDIFDVDASDIDSPSLTYSLDDNHGGLFSVDPATGIVSVNSDELFLSNSYGLQVNISDGEGGVVSQNLTVNVSGSEVVRLDMSGNTADSADSGDIADTGRLHNGASISSDGTLLLDGNYGYLDFNNSTDINSGAHEERSVVISLKTTNSTETQYIYGEGGGTRALQIYSENGVLKAQGYNKPSGENNWQPTTLDTGVNIADGQWHQVVVTLAGDPNNPMGGLAADGFKIYLDGNLEASGTGGALYSHANAHIGSDYNGRNTFEGELDSFKLYNQELSAEQISELNSATVYDGIIEGIYYETSSGLSGYTDSSGDFDYLKGDTVTFLLGNIKIGDVDMSAISDGKVFLQDIADVDRTDLSDEYVENMAVLLQSIDSDSGDNIVITHEMHEAFSDDDFDLATISEQELIAIIEETGRKAVSEDEAMEHVQDMLEEHAGLNESDFAERTYGDSFESKYADFGLEDIEDHPINLDGLFDNLGIAPEDRAVHAEADPSDSHNTILQIGTGSGEEFVDATDGSFAITLKNVSLNDTQVQDMIEHKNIIISDES